MTAPALMLWCAIGHEAAHESASGGCQCLLTEWQPMTVSVTAPSTDYCAGTQPCGWAAITGGVSFMAVQATTPALRATTARCCSGHRGLRRASGWPLGVDPHMPRHSTMRSRGCQ
jgi:hypothetical protein